MTDLARQLNLDGAVGVGHSMGGHSLTYAAGREPQRFAGLLLVDPTIAPPEAYTHRRGQAPPGTGGNLEYIERRRDEWASWEAMVERFGDRFPFEVWDRQVLEDYCRYGLLPDDDDPSVLRLACPPAVEADTYRQGGRADVYDVIPNIEVPVRVVARRRRNPTMPARPSVPHPAGPVWPASSQAPRMCCSRTTHTSSPCNRPRSLPNMSRRSSRSWPDLEGLAC